MIILIYDYINTIYQFIKTFLDKKCLFLRNMEPFKDRFLKNLSTNVYCEYSLEALLIYILWRNINVDTLLAWSFD